MQILCGDKHDIKVAGERAMLKAVVEDVDRTGPLARRTTEGGCPQVFILGKFAGLIAVFADDDWTSEASCDQEWLVAEVPRCSIGIHEHGATGFTTVSAREHVESDAALLEQFAQHYYERGLAGSADRDVSDADHWA